MSECGCKWLSNNSRSVVSVTLFCARCAHVFPASICLNFFDAPRELFVVEGTCQEGIAVDKYMLVPARTCNGSGTHVHGSVLGLTIAVAVHSNRQVVVGRPRDVETCDFDGRAELRNRRHHVRMGGHRIFASVRHCLTHRLRTKRCMGLVTSSELRPSSVLMAVVSGQWQCQDWNQLHAQR